MRASFWGRAVVLLALMAGCGEASTDLDDSSSGSDAVVDNAPGAVTEAATALKLGAPLRAGGGQHAVTTYFFEKADLVYNRVLGTVESVTYHDESLAARDQTFTLDGEVLAAAINFEVGEFLGTDDAARSRYDFSLAQIHWVRVHGRLGYLAWNSGSNPFGVVIQNDVFVAATSLRLGKLTNFRRSGRFWYFTFARGEIELLGAYQKITGITVKDQAVTGGANGVELPSIVRDAIMEDSFGRLVSVKTTAEGVDYEFQRATLALGARDRLGRDQMVIKRR